MRFTWNELTLNFHRGLVFRATTSSLIKLMMNELAWMPSPMHIGHTHQSWKYNIHVNGYYQNIILIMISKNLLDWCQDYNTNQILMFGGYHENVRESFFSRVPMWANTNTRIILPKYINLNRTEEVKIPSNTHTLLVRDIRRLCSNWHPAIRLCRAGPGHGASVTRPGYHIHLSQFCQHHRRFSA